MESQVIGTFFQEGVLTSLPVDVIIIRVKFLMENKVHVNLWRCGGPMVSALVSEFVPWPGHCVVFLGKTLYSHNAILHPGI